MNCNQYSQRRRVDAADMYPELWIVFDLLEFSLELMLCQPTENR